MKKFSFPLDRVLAWRRTQVRLEEAALARLHAERQALHLRIAALDRSVVDAQSQLLRVPSAAPAELGAMEHFRASASAQTRYLAQTGRALEAKIAAQTGIVVEKRRDAQLLEQLRERRFATWQAGVDREVEQQAEESYLARFSRISGAQSGMQ